MPYKSKYTREISKIKKWAKKSRGITVVQAYGQADRFMPEDKLIIINTQQSEENQLFTLLHECGHLMNRDRKMRYKNGKYKLLAKSDDMGGAPIKSYEYRIEFIEEEIKAWRNGEVLADRLGIKLEKAAYNACAAKFVMTYVDWAAERQWDAPA